MRWNPRAASGQVLWALWSRLFLFQALAAYLKKWYIHLDQVLFIIKDDFK